MEELKILYRKALSHKNISGIVISTRPDCVYEAILDYLVELSKDFYVSIEYGIESCYNDTLRWINRGHSFNESKEAVVKTSEKGLHVTGHILFGLPGESYDQMLKEA